MGTNNLYTLSGFFKETYTDILELLFSSFKFEENKLYFQPYWLSYNPITNEMYPVDKTLIIDYEDETTKT